MLIKREFVIMTEYEIVRKGQIEDEFEGFDDEMIFELTDGSFWIQDEYKYWYHYAYRPRVNILRKGGVSICKYKLGASNPK